MLCALLLLRASAVCAAPSPSPSPAPTPSDAQKSFAAKLVGAASAPAQNELLARAPAELFAGRGLRDALVRIGYDYGLRGDYPAAEKADRTIIRVGEKRHDAEMVAAGEILTGSVLRETGDFQAGLTLHERALAFYEQNPKTTPGKMSASEELGITYLHQGNFRRALKHLERGLQLARELHDQRGIIPALNSLGELFRTQGQPARALELYEQARREVGDDAAWNMAFIFNNIGMAYAAMGDRSAAIANIERARAVAEKVNFRPRVATSLLVLGELLLESGDLEKARRDYEQSLALSRDLHDQANTARALAGLAAVLRRQGRAEEALTDAQEAVALFRDVQGHDPLVDAQTELGRVLLSLGKTSEAAAAFQAAIDEVEKLRGQVVGGAEEAESFFQTRIAPYHEMISLLVAGGQNEEAFLLAQRSSARALLDTLASARKEKKPPPNESATSATTELERRLAEANRRLHAASPTASSPPAHTEELVTELQHLRARREILTAESAPEIAPVSFTEVPLPELEPLLDHGRNVLLQFVVTPERTFVFVVREKGNRPALETFTLHLGREEITRRASAFRTLLAERGLDWEEPAHALEQSLLEPLRASWQGAASLTIVPDGPLWELPFQALQTPDGRSLLQEHTIRYAPSWRFLVEGNRPPPAPAAARLFALADPALASSNFTASIIGESWERLPAASREVERLSQLYLPNDRLVLTGAAAREATFKQRAGDFDILHLATHGVINDHAPLYSYLLFSQENLPPNEDGLLEAWELMRMKLHARLAILSACETARGKVSDGEGMIGLSWALFAADCPAEIVSQWKVDSAIDCELMVNFHRHLRAGAPIAEALRQASLEMAKAHPHPFYWAPFVAMGQN